MASIQAKGSGRVRALRFLRAALRRTSAIALALLGAALPSVPALAISYAPIQFRQVSGTRPFISVQMNGKPFLMMIHANAKLYVMTTHANAAAIGLVNLGKTSDYGISADGHVSALGRTSAILPSLRLGASEATNVKLSVFEIPQTPPTDGMLGIDWLRDQHVIVDYDLGRVGVPATADEAQRIDAALVRRGYIAHALSWDPASRSYHVAGTIDGKTVVFGVSTVGQDVVDSVFAEHEGIALGPVVEQNGGPKGALVDTRIVKHQVAITIEGQKAASAQPWSWDLYAYSSATRPTTGPDQAFLGADFMLANQAIIDFGTATLFLPSD